MPKNKVWSEDVCVGLSRLWYVLMMMFYWPKNFNLVNNKREAVFVCS